MLDLRIERRAFVEPNGDLHEFVTYVLINRSNAPVAPEADWFQVPLTDASKEEAVSAWDGLPDTAGWEAGMLHGRFVFASRLRGEVPPRGERRIGFHALRRKRAGVRGNEFSFDDPFTIDPSVSRQYSRVELDAIVVFPEDDLFRR